MRKLYCLIVAMFFLFGANAQQTDSLKIKLPQTVIVRDLPEPPKHSFLSIVDGKQHFGRRIKKVNPKYIINTEVIKQNDAISKYGELGENGAVIIITKQYAIKAYQKKLSDFSIQYKTFMRENHNIDKGVEYSINGDTTINSNTFEVNPIGGILKLYNLPIKKIKALMITENPDFNGFGNKAIVAISVSN